MILSTSSISLAKIKRKAKMRQWVFMEREFELLEEFILMKLKGSMLPGSIAQYRTLLLDTYVNSKIILHLLFNYYMVHVVKLMCNLKSIKYLSPGFLFLFFLK